MKSRFTAKGIIALIISTAMGIIGVYMVASYGMAVGKTSKTKKRSSRTPETQPLLNSPEAVSTSAQVETDARARSTTPTPRR